jgi:hypothetical protein
VKKTASMTQAVLITGSSGLIGPRLAAERALSVSRPLSWIAGGMVTSHALAIVKAILGAGGEDASRPAASDDERAILVHRLEAFRLGEVTPKLLSSDISLEFVFAVGVERVRPRGLEIRH